MADDIVTRLRAIATRCWCAEKSQGEPVGKPFFRCESCDDQLRAADEIERLRAEINSMASAQAGWGRVALLEAEIERLRAAGDALAKQITRPCRCVEAHDGAINETCAACAAFFDWREARRG